MIRTSRAFLVQYTMPRAAKPVEPQVRILPPAEYPPELTRARGAYQPDVRFVALHPLGRYHVEHQGVGYHMAYFTPKRRGSRPQPIGAGRSLPDALARVADHEDQAMHPDASREWGQQGPVPVEVVGQRIDPKPRTQLEAEIQALLLRMPSS
jgi:hypothetical protein